MSLDSLTDEITPDERTIPVCTRGDLSARIEHLERDLAKAREEADTLDADGVRELAQEIADLQDEAAAFVHQITLRSIDGTTWRRLMRDHPPTEEQRRLGLDHDPEAFPHAAVAASIAQIDGEDVTQTAEQVERFAGKLSQGQWIRIWNACLDVNVRRGGAVPKSALATAILRASGRNSTTAARGESPTPSS